MLSLHLKELMPINQSSLLSNTSNQQTALRHSSSHLTPGHLISHTSHGLDLKTLETTFSDHKLINSRQMSTADTIMASSQVTNSWISTSKS